MPARSLVCTALLLAILTVACGRIGVELRTLDAEPLDASDRSDANVPNDAGTSVKTDSGALKPNLALSDAGPPDDDDAGMAVPVDAGMDAGPGAGMDASIDAAVDAGIDAGMDGGADAAVDAGIDAGTDAGPPPPCAGQRLYGLCWYLAQGNTSCNDACSSHGGFDSRSAGYVGTLSQGGSLSACTELLTALGRPGSVIAAKRDDDNGFGCHVWTDGSRYWLQNEPAFRPTVEGPNIRSVCGCMR
jgi:hypothetical protein